MENIEVRAVTYFAGRHRGIREEYEHGINVLERAVEILREQGLRVFTKRVSMIIVPSSVEGLARLTLDAYSLSRVKSRPLSLRAIPVDGEPGGRVRLGRFGEPFIIGY